MSSSDERLARYCSGQQLELIGKLGAGKDGTVHQTRSGSAVKVHERLDSYEAERDVYLRLLARGITEVCGLTVPVLFNFDDDLRCPGDADGVASLSLGFCFSLARRPT